MQTAGNTVSEIDPPGLPRVQLTTRGVWSSGRGCDLLVEHLKLDGGELAEGALAASAVIGAFDPGDDRQA